MKKEIIIINKTPRELKKERTDALIVRIAQHKQFKGRCNCCGTIWHRRGMLFHHLDYRSGEKNHKDFKGDRLAYYIYLEPIILAHLTEFEYLCTPCHGFVGKLRKMKDDKRIKRICETALRTRFIPPRGRKRNK